MFSIGKRILVVTLISTCAFASGSELLVSNYFGNSVGRYDLATNAFVGNFTGGSLQGTLGTRLGADGLVYVCSEINNSVQRFNQAGQFVDTFISGTGLAAPTGISFDGGGNAYVANFNDDSVSRYSPSGAFVGQFVASGAGGLDGPDVGTTIGPDGNLYAASFNSNAILRYSATTGAFLGTFASGGPLTQPRTILFQNEMVWVTSDSGNKVLRYRLDGTFIDTFVATGSGGLSGASGMVFGDDGNLYVSSWRNNRVIRYNGLTGAFMDTPIATGLNGPTFLTVVPEPASLAALGMGALAMLKRRRHERA